MTIVMAIPDRSGPRPESLSRRRHWDMATVMATAAGPGGPCGTRDLNLMPAYRRRARSKVKGKD